MDQREFRTNFIRRLPGSLMDEDVRFSGRLHFVNHFLDGERTETYENLHDCVSEFVEKECAPTCMYSNLWGDRIAVDEFVIGINYLEGPNEISVKLDEFSWEGARRVTEAERNIRFRGNDVILDIGWTDCKSYFKLDEFVADFISEGFEILGINGLVEREAAITSPAKYFFGGVYKVNSWEE